MKKLVLTIVLAVASPWCLAAESHEPLDSVYINLGDKESLQRGAKSFVNYCLSCHSAAYMRYNRIGKDLGISDANLKDNFLFAGDKVGDLMTISMSESDSKSWFGKPPPDLTLITRVRKPEWVYNYLRRFYADPESPHGWNNTLIENVAMPHVLYELQGTQRLVGVDDHGAPQFEIIKSGTMTPKEYDNAMRDLTNFLVYLGEPAKLQRYTVGALVLLFLVGLFVLTYFLKKEYWRELH